MRTVSNLLNHEGLVYVYLAGKNLGNLFLKNAEAEGFTFGDGVKPTEREWDDIFALNPDWTIHYVGWVGHMAFKTANSIGEQPLVKVDYGKYLSGSADYVMGLDA